MEPKGWTKPQAPGGIFFMAPGGAMGAAQRQCIVEFKGMGTGLVTSPLPNAVLLDTGKQLSVYDYHLTVHSNLMTHLKRGSDAASSIEIAPPALREGTLRADVAHLATVGLPPLNATPAQGGRFQKIYQGGSVIIPVIPDRQYSFGTSHLVVDLWATRPDFNAPGKLPAIVDNARAATTVRGEAAIGPLGATWAFRTEPVPLAAFWFRIWFATVPEAPGRPFFASAPYARLEASALDSLAIPRVERWFESGSLLFPKPLVDHFSQARRMHA